MRVKIIISLITLTSINKALFSNTNLENSNQSSSFIVNFKIIFQVYNKAYVSKFIKFFDIITLDLIVEQDTNS